MIQINSLVTYLPTSHGEHGVDATLHMLCMSGGPLHEVFSNPPGGSWTQFDLIRPRTEDVYRWDHIPREPKALVKRPDLVLQLNDGDNMNLLSVESKLNFQAAEENMSEKLMRYFAGTPEFTGLKQKPAWHSRKGLIAEPEIIEGVSATPQRWQVLAPDASENERYWFRDYPEQKIIFWSGFAYALAPEVYEDATTVNQDKILREMGVLQNSQPDLDVVIAIGWAGKFHEPFILRSYSKRFASSKMFEGLDAHLKPALLNP